MFTVQHYLIEWLVIELGPPLELCWINKNYKTFYCDSYPKFETSSELSLSPSAPSLRIGTLGKLGRLRVGWTGRLGQGRLGRPGPVGHSAPVLGEPLEPSKGGVHWGGMEGDLGGGGGQDALPPWEDVLLGLQMWSGWDSSSSSCKAGLVSILERHWVEDS